jgi:hypothetical protein
MKTTLSLLLLLMAGCASQATSTPQCDSIMGEGWGQGYGTEVESNSNLDSNRCAQFGDVWCCAL